MRPPPPASFKNSHFAHGRKSFASRGPVGLELTTLLAGPASNSNELPHTDQTTSGHRLSGKGGQGTHGTSKGGQGLSNESQGWPRAPKGGQGKPNQQPKGTKDCMRSAMWTPSGTGIHIPGQNFGVFQPTAPLNFKLGILPA